MSLHEGIFYPKDSMAEQQAMVAQNIVTKTTKVESRVEQYESNSTVIVSAHKKYDTIKININKINNNLLLK